MARGLDSPVLTVNSMKTPRLLLLSVCLAFSLHAQTGEPPAIPAPVVPATTAAPRTAEALDTLLGPIALYPDALVALILPAATTPSDVVLADRYAQAKGDPDAVAAQPWDDSVKALVRFPDVLKWMDDNLTWTQALGQAFLAQPADVMNAVQRLRARAQASGALLNTPQQHVLNTGNTIVIVPAQPEVIYVPVYDPQVVYVQRTVWVSHPLLFFGIGYSFGAWSGYDCDWGGRNIRVISRPHDWQNRPQSWNRAGIQIVNQPSQPWRPTVQRPRPQALPRLNAQPASANFQQPPSSRFSPTPASTTHYSREMSPSTPNRPAHLPVDRPVFVKPVSDSSGMIIAAPTAPVTTPQPAHSTFNPSRPARADANVVITPRPTTPITTPYQRPVPGSAVLPSTSAVQPMPSTQTVRTSPHWAQPPKEGANRPMTIQASPTAAAPVPSTSGTDPTQTTDRRKRNTAP